MDILVTAGNTLVPIDRVRGLTNVFTGRTGAAAALAAQARGHRVTLLTSHPEAVADLSAPGGPPAERWALSRYRTFDELRQLMEEAVRAGPDAVIHSAAVSDYLVAGVYAPDPQTCFRPDGLRWEGAGPGGPALADRATGKVKSDEPELWLRLVRAPKLVDLVRPEWGFRGLLVKFKLEVGVGAGELLEVAERSRQHSGADLMVANTLEGAAAYAYLGPLGEEYRRVSRRELADRLLDALEGLHRSRPNG
jgi:phosphopantothenoylcysteine synthetase/decarboxylase